VRRLTALSLLLAAAACAPGGDRPLWGDAPVQPLDLRGELATTEVPLLGEVELTLDLYVGEGLEVDFEPALPEGFDGAVAAREPRPLEDGGAWRRFTLLLRPTQLGELTIPPYEAKAKPEEGAEDGPVATTREWTVTVTTLLADSGPAVEAPAPLFPPRFEFLPWLAGGVALVALVAALWWWRRRAPKTDQTEGTPVPAHVKARRALGRLRNEPRSTPAQVERFYVEVSNILRVYLEERFGLHAPERTTEEFLAEIESGDTLTSEQRVRLRPFLTQCDLVKFARALPGEEVHLETFEIADQFVESTREDHVREGAA